MLRHAEECFQKYVNVFMSVFHRCLLFSLLEGTFLYINFEFKGALLMKGAL